MSASARRRLSPVPDGPPAADLALVRDELLTIDQVMAFLKMSRSQTTEIVRRHMTYTQAAGPNSRILVPRSELDRHLARFIVRGPEGAS